MHTQKRINKKPYLMEKITLKGGHVLISLPVSGNLTKQKPVDNNSNKKAKLTFEILHF